MKGYRALPFVFGLFFLALPSAAFAASLSLVPAASSVAAGNIITVRLVTSTAGAAINESGGTIQFPTDLFDVISVSKSNSIFTLWVEEPSFSNSAGTISFDGGLPNPGYTGAGTILSVTLHARKPGTATLSLSDAAVRANDGFGTNVLTSAGTAQINITGAATPTPTPIPTPTKPVTSPTISGGDSIRDLTSPSHPDQGLWYSDNNPRFSWTLPDGATAVETTMASTTDVVPTVVYQPAISQRQVKDLIDGSAYFNIRAKTKNGWGPTASYRVQIDATPPTLGNPVFTYDLIGRQLLITNIVPADQGSGISKFELVIDGAAPVLIQPSEIVNGTYRYTYKTDIRLLSAVATAQIQPSIGGTHTASLTAYDFANNHTTATGAFVVPVTLINQTLFSIFGINITLLWFILLILLLTLLSLLAAAAAWYRLYVLRQSSRSKTAKREQVVHRALSLFRTDLERHIKTLEQTSTSRKLTEEEEKLRADLAENLTDLERYLKKEFKKFD